MTDDRAITHFFVIAQRMRARYATLAEELGTTDAQMQLLELLTDGPLPIGEVATGLHCDPSNVTRLLDRLARGPHDDLIERRRRSDDRRVVELALTPSGRELVDEHRRRRSTDVPLFAGLSAHQRDQLATLLETVADAGSGATD